jgi:import inner membrane translocase subunit TIM16
VHEQRDSPFDTCLDAAAGGGVAAAARGGKEGVMDALTRKTGMSLEEACQILNVQKEADLAQLTKVRKTESKMNETDVLYLLPWR